MSLQIATTSSTFYQIGGLITMAGVVLAALPILTMGMFGYSHVYGIMATLGFTILFICAVASGDNEVAIFIGVIGLPMFVFLLKDIVRDLQRLNERES